jgi:hypothetical protein
MNLLVYSVKIMRDHVETISTTATKSPISVPYIYNANFQLMVIKHAGETNNCAVARKFHVAEQNIYYYQK